MGKLENLIELENLIKHFEKKFGVVVSHLLTDRLGRVKRYSLVEELAVYSTEKELKKQERKQKQEIYLDLPKEFLPKPKGPVEIFEEKYKRYNKLPNDQLCAAYCRVFGRKENKQFELLNYP